MWWGSFSLFVADKKKHPIQYNQYNCIKESHKKLQHPIAHDKVNLID